MILYYFCTKMCREAKGFIMKKHPFLTYCACILLALIAVSCSTGNKEQKIVTVTIQPQKYFAEKIAGDRFDINCIVPPGSNPEAYDPSPSHLVHLGKSIAYFKIGHIGFELAWMDKLEQNNPHMKIFDNSEGINILSGTHEHSEGDEHHHHYDADPHTWSSPKNARIIAKNMYDAFVSLDPSGEKVYRRNYEELLAEINHVDSVMTRKLTPITCTSSASNTTARSPRPTT